MKNYEVMFILKPDLSADEKKNLFNQLSDVIVKNDGNVSNAAIWLEKRKLYFIIKKHKEGLYYLMNFTIKPETITKLKHIYALNENILRLLITKTE